MTTATLITKATDKCCDWCGIGDHYTYQAFEKDGQQVVHCHRGCEHPAEQYSADDIRSLYEFTAPAHHASACKKHH